MLFIYKEFGSLFSLTLRKNQKTKNLFHGPLPQVCVYHLCPKVWGFFFSCMEAILYPRVLHMALDRDRQLFCVVPTVASIICVFNEGYWLSTVILTPTHL